MEKQGLAIQTRSLSQGKTYYDPELKMNLPDKRYLPRWEVKNKIGLYLEEDREQRECKSHDLSSVGICLQTRDLLPVDHRLKLVVHLSEDTAFPVEGRVVWSRPAEGGYQSGVVFENISQHDQELILQYAFEVRHDDLVKHWFNGWNG
jgi:hypothetical protein